MPIISLQKKPVGPELIASAWIKSYWVEQIGVQARLDSKSDLLKIQSLAHLSGLLLPTWVGTCSELWNSREPSSELSWCLREALILVISTKTSMFWTWTKQHILPQRAAKSLLQRNTGVICLLWLLANIQTPKLLAAFLLENVFKLHSTGHPSPTFPPGEQAASQTVIHRSPARSHIKPWKSFREWPASQCLSPWALRQPFSPCWPFKLTWIETSRGQYNPLLPAEWDES